VALAEEPIRVAHQASNDSTSEVRAASARSTARETRPRRLASWAAVSPSRSGWRVTTTSKSTASTTLRATTACRLIADVAW